MKSSDGKLIQDQILQQVKNMLMPEERLVDVLAEMFKTSTDSAYRRIRLEKLMTLDELIKLCTEFDLSFDEFLNQSTRRITFSYQPISEKGFTFVDYLEYVERMSRKIQEAKQKEMLYMANDIPMYHLMNAPELASFKLFFWQKTILNFDSLRNTKFKLGMKDERVNSASRLMRDHYFKIPSIEIYSPETIDITLKQINYYYEAGIFESDEIATYLCERLLGLITHLRNQCELGFKFRRENAVPEKTELTPTYQVYYNEVLYTDTTILASLDDERWSYTNNNGLNVMSTKDANYFNQQKQQFEILKSKSTLISGDSEKERNRVFKIYERKVKMLQGKFENLI